MKHFIKAYKVTNSLFDINRDYLNNPNPTIFEDLGKKIYCHRSPFLRIRDCEIIEHESETINQKYLLIKYNDEYYIVHRKDFQKIYVKNPRVKSFGIMLDDDMQDFNLIENNLLRLCNRESRKYSRGFNNSKESISVDEIVNVLNILEPDTGYFFIFVKDVRDNFHVVGYYRFGYRANFKLECIITSF